MNSSAKEFEQQELIDLGEISNEELLDDELYLQQDRLSRKAKSRNRHINNLKAKRKIRLSSSFLSSKLRKLAQNSTPEEVHRLNFRERRATKKASRLK